jgi:hypothetical protein
LIAAYPVIALLANNIEEVKAAIAIRPLLISLLVCSLLFILLKLLLKNSLKAGLATTIILIFFFAYGHVYNFFELSTSVGLIFGRHRYLAPIWAVAFSLLLLPVLRTQKDLRTVTSYLNIIAAVALLLPLSQIVIYEVRVQNSGGANENLREQITGLSLPASQPPPDVYYIILDAYAREDYLREEQGFDNRPFLTNLEHLGFIIADCSLSNYAQTQLSMASSLNMDYIQSLGSQFKPGNTSRVGVDDLIRHGVVRKAFESLGYSTVAFETGFKYTQWEDADVYLSPTAGALDAVQFTQGLNEFEAILIETTAALILSDSRTAMPRLLQPDFDNPRRIHRERIQFALDQLGRMPDRPGPKFVFAHLVIPHPPYVFDSNGGFTDYDVDAKTGYIDQIEYVNKRLLPLLEDIISTSKTPPIIILQGDHGAIHSTPEKRLDILNAFYLPGIPAGIVTGDITPVNTFSVILNAYFGGKYPHKEDIGYYSSYKDPYNFSVIANQTAVCP